MGNKDLRKNMEKYNINEIPDSLVSVGVERHFPAGMNIFHVDERITHCYLILSGMVKIYIDHEKRTPFHS
jgi:CRP/FNR family putative post-exponential-phase nitrogen-starvation transcriptional regulator